MAPQRNFGRRAVPQSLPVKPVRRDRASNDDLESASHIAEPAPPIPEIESEPEQALRPSRIAWRQISLMAGLCFGVASLVLPDSVNDAANWLLYALTAASFYVSWRGRLSWR